MEDGLKRGQFIVALEGKGTVKAASASGWDASSGAVKGFVNAESKALDEPTALDMSAFKEVGMVQVRFASATHQDVLVNRSTRELDRIGIIVLDLGENEAVFALEGVDPGDVPFAVTILRDMMDRAYRKVTHSDHQLSWYDLKQAIGLVWAVQGGDTAALEVMQWGDNRNQAARDKEKEELRAKKKAEAEAKAKAAQAEEGETANLAEAGDES